MVSDLANTLSTQSAHVLAAVYALSYVGSIYVSKGARLSFTHTKAYLDFGRLKAQHERWRDDPGVIRARSVAVSVVTILCCVGATVLVRTLMGNETDHSTVFHLTAAHLGFTSLSFLPFFITPALYLGPLYARSLGHTLPFQRNWSFQEDVVSFFFSVTGMRNYLVAPITEEVVFRACVLSGYYFAGASRSRMIFLSPMVFGAAHVHHAWETYNKYGRSPAALKCAAIGTVYLHDYIRILLFIFVSPHWIDIPPDRSSCVLQCDGCPSAWP